MKNPTVRMAALTALVGLMPLHPCSHARPAILTPPDSGRVTLHVDAAGFFINDEYYGTGLDGYTLPGFLLTPRAVWKAEPHVSLEAGAHWLHFWGASGYPDRGIHEPWMPGSAGTAHKVHLVPWLRAEAWLHDSVRLTLGTLHREEGHGLPLPLYNPERLYTTDPEAGIQLWTGWGPWEAEVWTDWQEFVWRNDTRQEQFVFGATASGRLPIGHGWALQLPLHLLASHHGGQGLAGSAPSGTRYNAAASPSASYLGPRWHAVISCHAATSFEYGNPTAGWGLYPTLQVGYLKAVSVEAGFWHGYRFCSLEGNPLFADPQAFDPAASPHNRMATAAASLAWTRFKHGSAKIEGRFYYRIGHPHPAQFGMGAYIDINPTLTLLR